MQILYPPYVSTVWKMLLYEYEIWYRLCKNKIESILHNTKLQGFLYIIFFIFMKTKNILFPFDRNNTFILGILLDKYLGSVYLLRSEHIGQTQYFSI